MEVIEEKIQTQRSDSTEFLQIMIECPVCESEKKLNFPRSVINNAKKLTTISIPKGLVCEHHFQAFVDKSFMVRGYQKVDFEYASDIIKTKELAQKERNSREREFSEYIIIEENYLAYKPKENQIIIERKYDNNDLKKAIENKINSKNKDDTKLRRNGKKILDKKSKMNLKDIYDEFWDFIDENNKDFQEFIQNDQRRENLTINF
ncbi:MAG: hypothetical protein ACFE78_13850 [Candidatus Hodarchaeota archaeon]